MAQNRNQAAGRGLLSPLIPLLMLVFAAGALLVAALSGCGLPARSSRDLVVTSFTPEAEEIAAWATRQH